MRVDKDKLIQEATERFQRSVNYEGKAKEHWIEDYKFGHGDSYNQFQWPEQLYRTRSQSNQPCLTINKTRQHCLQIVASIVQSEATVKFIPTGEQASAESADILEGIARHIQYTSNVKNVYHEAIKHQVFAGLGYFRVITDYRDNDSQEQDIFIRWVKDPTRVYIDPDTAEPDGSDARYAFVYDEMERGLFEETYPNANVSPRNDTFGTMWRSTRDDKHVGVVEYYRRVTRRDKVYFLEGGGTALGSELPAAIKEALDAEGRDKRSVESHEIQWFKLCGDQILEKTIWPGTIIPICPVVGEETVIDGELDRKGHVRTMIDAQRMYNYNRSAATHSVALQSKTPYIGPMEAFSGLETYWENANRIDYAWLPYNGLTDDGTPIAPPQRQAPPIIPEAYSQGAEMAAADMQMVSGQYEASMAQQGNEVSGVAIQQRQAQGENGAFHYQQNFEMAVRLLGKILLDLIPKIYTAERVIKIMAEDGTQSDVKIDPNAPQALQQSEDQQQQKIAAIFNPNIGKYEVEAEVGPGFLTRRQQEFDALVQIVTQAPDMMKVVGDIMMRNAPFPGAEEIAERLHNMVPPQALGGPSPELMAAQAQIQQMQAKMAALMHEMAEQRLKHTGTNEQKAIDTYEAETRRLALLKDIDPAILIGVGRQAAAEALSNPLSQVDQTIDQALASVGVNVPQQNPPQGASPSQPEAVPGQ